MSVEQVDARTKWASRAGIEGYSGYDSNWLVGWDGVRVVKSEKGNLAQVHALALHGDIVS